MRHDLTANPEVIEARAGDSRLLSRLYHDVGLAAVAAEFELPAQDFDPELAEALERGTRYLAAPNRVLAS
ncbi:MAG: hypothetical protein ABR878_11325 [Roseiarcus sp.]|jgi:hypothetical protein